MAKTNWKLVEKLLGDIHKAVVHKTPSYEYYCGECSVCYLSPDLANCAFIEGKWLCKLCFNAWKAKFYKETKEKSEQVTTIRI